MFITRLLALVIIAISIMGTKAVAKSLEDYTRQLAEHPQVTQILQRSSYYSELSNAQMGLPNPDLIIGVDNMPINNPEFNRFLPTSKVLGLKQQIPSHSLREAKSQKQKQLSKRQKIMADYTVKRLEAILIHQLTELDKINELEKLANKQLKLYRSMEGDLRGQLEAGNPVYGRFSEIDVERTEVEQRLNYLKVERITIEQELISLVGEVPEIQVPSVEVLSWSSNTDVLYPIIIANEETQIADKDVDVADAAFNPNYGVQAIYKQREEGESFAGDDWFSLQATVSIPLWYNFNQQPRLRAAEAGKLSAEFAYEDTKRQWVKRMTILDAEIDITMDNIKLLKDKKSALKKMVQAAKRNYESGNTSLETVLDAQIDELTIASQLARQRSKHIQLSVQYNSHIIGGGNENN